MLSGKLGELVLAFARTVTIHLRDQKQLHPAYIRPPSYSKFFFRQCNSRTTRPVEHLFDRLDILGVASTRRLITEMAARDW